MAAGTPEDVAEVRASYTGRYLKDLLARRPVAAPGPVTRPKPKKSA